MSSIRTGTASWTEKTLMESGAFYPEGADSAEDRLRYYAGRFSTVEVDSSYYALPSERNSHLWVERTPDLFVFHLKAFSLLTGHPTPVSSLPKAVAEGIDVETGRVTPHDLDDQVVDTVFSMFLSAIEPLNKAGRLGCLLFAFPPWFVPRAESWAWLDRVRDRTAGHAVAVEFRHKSWLEHDRQAAAFLRERNMAHVAVDAPWIDGFAGPGHVTAPDAYIRLSGRNRANWYKKNTRTADRYRHLYSDEELGHWVHRAREAAQHADRVWVIFNNCFEDFGIRNAKRFTEMV